MERIVGILVVAAMAALILLLSYVRKRRIQPYLDAFARAFCEASAHLMNGTGPAGRVRTEALADGRLRLLPAAEQPAGVRAALEKGADDYMMTRLGTMCEMRAAARTHLTTFNLIGRRINSVLDRVYDLAEQTAVILRQPDAALSASALEDLDFFLNRQAYIRGTTLSAIVSEACKADIVV